MLEASDDLTNLSHLNEPAGMHTSHSEMADSDTAYSAPSDQAEIFTKGDLHIFRYRPDCYESLCSSRLAICTWNGSGICWETTSQSSATFVCNC
jgi:hypothetical protein